MKNLNLKDCGLVELGVNEKKINGGFNGDQPSGGCTPIIEIKIGYPKTKNLI